MVGPNGAGKTTLLKAILGLVRVIDGQVLLDGQRHHRRPLEELGRPGIGYVPQVDDVFDTLRVTRTSRWADTYSTSERAERIEEVLEIFPVLAARTSGTSAR